MNPTLEGTQTGEQEYRVDIRPDRGNPVTLYVLPAGKPEEKLKRDRDGRLRFKTVEPPFHVKRDPASPGCVSSHRTFEAAVKSANSRAKRYLHSCTKGHKS